MLKLLLFILIVGVTSLPLVISLWRRRSPGADLYPARHLPSWQIALSILGFIIYGSLSTLARFYADVLWWREDLRQPAAFWTLFWTKWGWGLGFAALAVLFVLINLAFVRQQTAADTASGRPHRMARAFSLVALFFAFLIGVSFGHDHWREILLFKNRLPFGMSEPIFNRDLGFYLFTYPFLRLLNGWFIGLVLLTVAIVVVLHLVRAADRLGLAPGPHGQIHLYMKENVQEPAWNRLLTHASLLAVLLFVGFFIQSRLAIWGLMYSTRGVVHGPGYTDVHVMIPALNAMSVAIAIGTVLLLFAVLAHSLSATVKAVGAGVGLVLLVWIVGLQIIPSIVQRYSVSPNETNLEIPYIRNNMKFTRLGFGLTDDRIELRDFPPVQPIEKANLVSDEVTLSNVRLWDWRALEATYDQNQSFRQYYDFFDVDIDRYVVNGRVRQVMLSLRELNPRSFSENAATWVNMRQIYTHGYGLCLNPTNEFNPEGLPNYWVRDIPPVAIDSVLAIRKPQIYYGELTDAHVYARSGQKEFDYPKGDENVYATYQGEGGIPLGAGLRRLALALEFDGLRQLTSSDLGPQSRLLFRRDVIERLAEAAPFLVFDHDPYAVVAGGRQLIVVDAYTVSHYFPYSEKFADGLNYIRNSVKATVDCYDGTVRFYVFDESDPLIRAWRTAFPALFLPASEMPAELRPHVRYPEDFLAIQARIYSTYHMTDPLVFYNKEDRWAIARETLGGGEPREMIPYYAVLRMPGEAREEFVQLIAFTPFSVNQPKNNMVGWMAGRCDGDEYGKLLVYRFPKQSLVYGPMQIQARVDQDAVISKDLTLWNQQGSSVIRGNLIVLPLENALIYTEPIFLQATHSRMPELKRVVVASQDRLGYGETFADALADLVEGQIPDALFEAISGPGHERMVTSADTSGAGIPLARQNETPDLKRAREFYRQYLLLSGSGRLSEAGRELEKLGEALGVERPGAPH